MPDLNNRRDLGAPDGQVGRRAFLKGLTAVSASAIGARGVYELLEKSGVTRPTPAAAAGATVRRLQEQYLVQKIEAVLDNGVTCAIPPLHNDVITAKLKSTRTWNTSALKAAQTRLENALNIVESPYPDTAAGLTIVVGWGLPFFRTFLPAALQAKLPVDVALSKQSGSTRYAVLDAMKFPSDPDTVLLEDNHVMFKFRSDSPDILRQVESALFDDTSNKAYIGDLFDLTSKRIGFLGRGFGTTSVAKSLAVAAGVPGAEQIPDNAQLMLGFTSTQTAALGPGNIVSFETLPGVTDQWPNGYFAAGCAMHLSHLYEDLSAWYTSPYASRVNRMFSPHTPVPADQNTVTLPNGPADVTSPTQLNQDATGGILGHNETLQQATRLATNITDNYGQTRSAGTAVPIREDFNTIDNPFAWSANPARDGWSSTAAAGMHFVAFVPASSKFHAARNAMDGLLPDGTNLRAAPYNITDANNGINGVIRASHRQNYLIPPRRHRSFPLVELLT
jgi:hypothetical protein